jgi:hypothetical protein
MRGKAASWGGLCPPPRPRSERSRFRLWLSACSGKRTREQRFGDGFRAVLPQIRGRDHAHAERRREHDHSAVAVNLATMLDDQRAIVFAPLDPRAAEANAPIGEHEAGSAHPDRGAWVEHAWERARVELVSEKLGEIVGR